MKMLSLMVLLGTTACASVPPMPEPTGPCAITDLVRARYLATKFRTETREDIQRDTNSRTARVLRPGDAMTMDLRPDRVNILVDDGGKIDGLRCG